MYEFDIDATPTTAPFMCVCGAGLPGDGPYLRVGPRNQFGDIWLCGAHQEVVLAANRLMSLRLYEQRSAELKASVEAQVESLRAEKERLEGIERREVEAVQLAKAMTERAE
jgi:hypothetical protein